MSVGRDGVPQVGEGVLDALGRASWRVKAGIGCLVSAKVHGVAAALAVLGMVGQPGLRTTAVALLVLHAASVVGALGLAGWEYGATRPRAPG